MDVKLLCQLSLASIENAKELLEESEILFKNGFYSRSIFLAQIGGEEIGKHLLCISNIVKSSIDIFDGKAFEKLFRNHKFKQQAILNMEDLLLDKNKEFETIVNINKDISSDLEKIKQWSLYSDFYGDICLQPNTIFKKETAENSILWLRNRINLFYRKEIIDGLKDYKKEEFRSYITNLYETIGIDIKI